jgi:hypothetical protein
MFFYSLPNAVPVSRTPPVDVSRRQRTGQPNRMSDEKPVFSAELPQTFQCIHPYLAHALAGDPDFIADSLQAGALATALVQATPDHFALFIR